MSFRTYPGPSRTKEKESKGSTGIVRMALANGREEEREHGLGLERYQVGAAPNRCFSLDPSLSTQEERVVSEPTKRLVLR
jgi:hypothetical protein